MAETPEYVEAPVRISVNGVLAFAPGDPVPYATAKALGLTGRKPPTGAIFARADENGIIATGETAGDVAGDAAGSSG